MDPWTAPPPAPSPPAVPPVCWPPPTGWSPRSTRPSGPPRPRGDRRHHRRLRDAARAPGRRRGRRAGRGRGPQDRQADSLAWSSTGDWYTHLAGTHPRTGRRTVRHAKLLVTERTATRDALRDGLVSPEQAGVICDAIEELPTNPHLRELAEKTLLAEAGRLHASRPRQGRPPPPARRRPRRRRTQGTDGTSTPRTAPPTCAATSRSPRTAPAASACAAAAPSRTPPPSRPPSCRSPSPPPPPSGTGDGDCGEGEDVRDHGARMWDAVVQICEHALSTDLPPDAHGARPRVAVTISLDALQAAPSTGRRSPTTAPSCPPPPSAAWRATPTSSPSSSAPAARCSTSAGRTGSSPRPCGGPWCAGTGTARSPAAPGPR